MNLQLRTSTFQSLKNTSKSCSHRCTSPNLTRKISTITSKNENYWTRALGLLFSRWEPFIITVYCREVLELSKLEASERLFEILFKGFRMFIKPSRQKICIVNVVKAFTVVHKILFSYRKEKFARTRKYFFDMRKQSSQQTLSIIYLDNIFRNLGIGQIIFIQKK